MGDERKTKAELIAELESLRARIAVPGPLGDSESEQLVENLRLHQIELEMQNRALREVQHELEASRDRYADLYDFAPVGYATLDAKGNVREINLTGASLLGVERSRLLGKPLLGYVARADTSAFAGQLRTCRDSGKAVAAEVRLAVRGGEMWANVHCVPLPAGTDAAGCRVVITDATERKEAEAERAHLLGIAEEARAQAEAANREKDEFLAIVSHELRTPLNAILGWSQLLLTGRLDANATARALESIARGAHVQGKLISDLLDVARIVSGKVSLDRRPSDLAALVSVAFESIEHVARSKNVEVRLLLETALVLADPVRMQQVVWNLLSNAIKFTPAGGNVEVAIFRDQGCAQLVVHDSGEGIESEILPRIFDRFRQADTTTRRQHSGIGLGLAIVRHIVELHEGTIQVISQGKGRGATFVVNLPLLESVEGGASSFARSAATPDPAPIQDGTVLEGLHVLVVEDVEDALTVFTMLLETGGARVTSVGSARAAMEAIERERPDVIVSDIGMPDEDGYDLIHAVRMLEPGDGGWIPAVALTAYASQDDRERTLAAGFQAHVTKPVTGFDLVAVVARVAGIRSLPEH